MLAQSTRPKCKADTYYLPMPDGVYLRGNSSRLILKGKSLYPLLAHLMPNLTGDLTLEELTADLDGERKRMIMHLIEKLFAHQFLRDASQDQFHALDPMALATHAPDLAFIESFQTSPASRFDAFCQQRLLLLGSGSGLTALVQAGRQCGVRQVDALLTQPNADTAQDLLACFSRDTREGSMRVFDAPRWDNEVEIEKILREYDAILHITEPSRLAQTQLLNRLCLTQQKVCLQAVVTKQRAWIGPLVFPASESCWECAWRRIQPDLAARSDASLGAELAQTNESTALTDANAEMIANHLLFELFHHFTQTSSPEEAAKVCVLDLSAYTSESHTFLPHPQCQAHQHASAPTASQFLAHVTQLRQQTPREPQQMLETLASWMNVETGLLHALDTGNFVQVPLAIYCARLARGEQGDASRDIIAAGIDTRSTLLRAAQKACERYALSMVDQHRLLSQEDAQQTSCTMLASEQLKGQASSLLSRDLWTWALDLHTQEAVLVPTEHVFAGQTERARGVGSGQTWEEALCQGLLDWSNALTIERIKEARQAYPQLDLATLSMTPEGEYLYQQLNTSGCAVTAYDLTDALGIPTCAFCLAGKTVAYTTHCDPAQALYLGLEQTLQQHQSELFGQPEYALAPVADLPTRLRGEHWSAWNASWPTSWPERLTRLLTMLAQHGLHTYAVPLEHDPALAEFIPFITRVLVCQSGMEKGE